MNLAFFRDTLHPPFLLQPPHLTFLFSLQKNTHLTKSFHLYRVSQIQPSCQNKKAEMVTTEPGILSQNRTGYIIRYMCQQNQIYFINIGTFPAKKYLTKPDIFDKSLGHFPTRYLKPKQDLFQTPNQPEHFEHWKHKKLQQKAYYCFLTYITNISLAKGLKDSPSRWNHHFTCSQSGILLQESSYKIIFFIKWTVWLTRPDKGAPTVKA